MRILLDAGVPWLTRQLLEQRGHNVIHANEVQLGASDLYLVDLAVAQNRIIVTLDADFHAILATRRSQAPSIARLRIQMLRHEEAAHIIGRILERFGHDLEQGAVISANRIKVRIRRLPL